MKVSLAPPSKVSYFEKREREQGADIFDEKQIY
jgi:hypothetical protein